MKKHRRLPKYYLQYHYIYKNKTVNKLSKELKVSRNTLKYYLKKYRLLKNHETTDRLKLEMWLLENYNINDMKVKEIAKKFNSEISQVTNIISDFYMRTPKFNFKNVISIKNTENKKGGIKVEKIEDRCINNNINYIEKINSLIKFSKGDLVKIKNEAEEFSTFEIIKEYNDYYLLQGNYRTCVSKKDIYIGECKVMQC